MRASKLLAVVLILASAAGQVAAQSAGQTPGPGLAASGGVTLIDSEHPATGSGEIRLWRAYSRGGARVILKVYRSESDRLVMVGASALETVPPETVVTFRCSIPISRGDLIGCYCPDVNCVDLLANGVALTSNGDVGTSEIDDLVVKAGTPAIFAAASRNVDLPSPAARNLVLPVAARSPGLNRTSWITTLEIFNTASTATTATLYLNRSNHDNTLPWASAQIELPARATVVIDDLLLDTFAISQGSGSVDLLALAPIMAHARIANVGAADGSYGQLVPALPVGWAVADDNPPGTNPNGDTLHILLAREDSEWRTNLGVASISATPLTVVVTAMVGTGAVGNQLNLQLPPFSHTQINQVLEQMEVPSESQGVRLQLAAEEGSVGRFFAYASRVENQTGDAIFIAGVREPTLP
jgi:hypothetical protein